MKKYLKKTITKSKQSIKVIVRKNQHSLRLAKKTKGLIKATPKNLSKHYKSLKYYPELRGVKKQYKHDSFNQDKIKRRNNTKIAVIVHLYYVDAWEVLSRSIKSLEGHNFDIFVSLPKQNTYFANEIKKVHKDAYIFEVPNKGRDVLPFIKIALLVRGAGYKYVLKMHSKKSAHRTDGNDWFIDMVNSLLPANKKIIEKLVVRLEDRNTGIIGPKNHYVSLVVNYDSNKAGVYHVLRRIFSKKQCDKLIEEHNNFGFFEGTMFWARIDALTPILNKWSSENDFEREGGQIDATLAHALERAFSIVPELNQKNLFEISTNGIQKLTYKTENIPDWSEVYTGPKKINL